MAESSYVLAVDEIQAALTPLLKSRGYRRRGRTFNHLTEDGLTQVVGFQMGPFDPPGTTYVSGLTENLYGYFTVNLGVYVPEVHRDNGGGEIKGWVHDYHCCIRARLGPASGEARDLWWRARVDDAVIGDVRGRLELGGLPFLDRFASRDMILAEFMSQPDTAVALTPARIVMAIILAERGCTDAARGLLARQALETRNPGHPAYVRELARRLSLGELDS